MPSTFKRKRGALQKGRRKGLKKARKYAKRKRGGYRKFAASKDPTVMKFNPGKPKKLSCVKSTVPLIGGALGIAGSTGLQLQLPANTNLFFSGCFSFDPSGVNAVGSVYNKGNRFSGYIGATSNATGTCKIQDWDSLALLYDFYKITKITISIRYTDAQNADENSPELWMRYVNKYDEQLPTPTSIAQQQNWICKKFNSQSSDFKYSFYPKVFALYDNLGTSLTVTDTRITRKMPYTPMTNPIEVWGFQYYINYPGGGANASSSNLNMDVTYHMKFKEQA